MPSANSGHAWLSNPDVAYLLRRLATGDLALAHAALDELEGSRTVEHLRGLLVVQGCLPPRDRHLAGYERWLVAKLDTVADPSHAKIVDRFARWHLLRQLRRRATSGPISDGAFLNAKQTTTVTVGFLTWLCARGGDLDRLTQHDLDAWFAAGPSTRKHVVRFLYWARDQRLIDSQLEVPVRRTTPAQPAGTTARLELLRRVLTEPDCGNLAVRVAGALVLLFGATARQLAGLTLADLTHDSDQSYLKLGAHPVPLPAPVSALLVEFVADPRYRRNTAANHASHWLFPGARPGRQIRPNTLSNALRQAGIPTRAVRAGTWIDLVRTAPAPLLAQALGVSPVTAARYAERAGSAFTGYPRSPDLSAVTD